MAEIDVRIEKFLKKHHVMTLATCGDGGVWCCNLFYAYQDGRFVFTSKSQTRHIEEGLNSEVALSVVLESKVIGNLQGAQIVGKLVEGTQEDKNRYLKRFPYAALSIEQIWAVEVQKIKFTDNKLGFGVKLYYGFENNNV